MVFGFDISSGNLLNLPAMIGHRIVRNRSASRVSFFSLFRRGLNGNVVLSYPKSGRTWVRYALNLAGAPVQYNHGGYATRDPAQLGYRFEGVRPAFFGEKTVFLHRNPIDTAVSEYYQLYNRIFTPEHPRYAEMQQRLAAANLLPPDTVDAFVLHPVWGCSKVSAFNRAHIDYFSNRKNAKIVTYEELRADTRHKLSELLDYLGVVNYDIDHIVAESSFQRMREIEISADPETKKKNKLYGMRNNDANTLKVRRGKVNGYLDELGPETVEAARALCRAHGFSA